MGAIASSGLGRWLLYLLIAGNGVAFVIGVLLWLQPQRYLRWFEPKRGSPRSVRQLLKPVDVMRDSDSWLLSRPRLVGAVIIASSLFILIKGGLFVSGMSLRDGGKMLARLFGNGQGWSPQAWEYLWQNLVSLLALGAGFALVIGLVAFSRFELFQRWSALANRWVSGRRATKDLAQPYYVPDGLVRARPRVWGAVISVSALYSATILFWLVLRG
jgi:hypothetical protein